MTSKTSPQASLQNDIPAQLEFSRIDSYAVAPECIVIDMDPTANRVYGDQQLALFNDHYDGYCLMPFHVYDGLTGRLLPRAPVCAQLERALRVGALGPSAPRLPDTLVHRGPAHLPALCGPQCARSSCAALASSA